MAAGEAFRFGPFELDAKARRLSRGGEVIPLAPHQFDLLHLLVARAGEILSKDLLLEAVWNDVAVTDNSLAKAVSRLRAVLEESAGQPYIKAQKGRGYRFAADVVKVHRRERDEMLDALLAPHRAWIDGRAALETLDRDEINRARLVFQNVLTHASGQASAHVGLANARAMQFEMTRSDPQPDARALEEALSHASEACRLDPQYGEAWATVGFVSSRIGRQQDALAALRRAVTLEPDNWRHHFRLGYISWGEERLREARRTLALLPGFALAHWLAASVYVARQALGDAEREVVAGLAGQVSAMPHRFSAVALHWLRGLLLLARGDLIGARSALHAELANEGSRHLYARECCANTWYALGALEWRSGKREAAADAFRQALERVSTHHFARLGLAAATGLVPSAGALESDADHSIDAAMLNAVRLQLTGGSMQEAATGLERALSAAPPGNGAWLLPIEPMLHVSAEPGIWSGALAALGYRAA